MRDKLSEEASLRRSEELAALEAYYDDALLPSLTPTENDNNTTDVCHSSNIPLQGPWFIQLGNQSLFGLSGIPTLEIRLPSSYPFGNDCPTPILHNVMMNPQVKEELLQELRDMYEVEMDVGIMWGERCREEIVVLEEAYVAQQQLHQDDDDDQNTTILNRANNHQDDSQEVQTFIPPTTRYNQPIRHFPTSIIYNPKYQREIMHTPPFHPPKSGAAENMIAHVCEVTCMEHVHWALAELLFNDKKVAKATHNMFAYRFHQFSDDNSTTTLVHDNDDDGEKGSGAKLASLLELSGAENVLVVVSRWYGGQLLGPARFKWIAGVARTGLVQGGFINGGD